MQLGTKWTVEYWNKTPLFEPLGALFDWLIVQFAVDVLENEFTTGENAI